jgi:hypothetical protein
MEIYGKRAAFKELMQERAQKCKCDEKSRKKMLTAHFR